MQKQSDTKVRKFPLPLQLKLGSDGSLSDGLFTLTGKECDVVKILSVDGDGFVSLEIHPVARELAEAAAKFQDLLASFKIGSESSRTKGKGKDFGKYTYYRLPDRGYIAEVTGGVRDRTFDLGSMKKHSSTIFRYATTIVRTFGKREFSKKDLMLALPKELSFGQIVKSVLDVLKIERYLERREGEKEGKSGRIREWFKATEKLVEVVTIPDASTSPEQA